jgi:DNA polymerase III alpha subunit
VFICAAKLILKDNYFEDAAKNIKKEFTFVCQMGFSDYFITKIFNTQ